MAVDRLRGGVPPPHCLRVRAHQASGGAASLPPAEIVKTVWMLEAEKIASSQETSMGKPSDGADGANESAAEDSAEDLVGGGSSPTGGVRGPARDPKTHYVLTGSPEWRAATKAERRAVIEAFATNAHYVNVSMSDSMVDDDLARSWASVLACPTCAIETLTLESNPIASAGIEAIASALPSNASLRTLKLRNLMGRVSKEAEEALAASLEQHTRLVAMPFDAKSYKAKDDIGKFLQRNEMTRREEKGWHAKPLERVSMGHEAGWRPESAPPPRSDPIPPPGALCPAVSRAAAAVVPSYDDGDDGDDGDALGGLYPAHALCPPPPPPPPP